MSLDYVMNAVTLLQMMSNLVNVNKSGKRKEGTGVGYVWHTLNIEYNYVRTVTIHTSVQVEHRYWAFLCFFYGTVMYM